MDKVREFVLSLIERGKEPTNIGSIVIFRISFGLLVAWDCVRYVVNGWAVRSYSDETLHFRYALFDWVVPLNGIGMNLVFLFAAFLGVMIALGWFYRFTTILFTLTFGYIFLIDKANYLNHFYVIILISFLMWFIPAQRAFSVDARRRPIIAADTAPAWCLLALRFQLITVYTYAAIAKIKYDWLFRAEPLKVWLAKFSDLPVIGPLMTDFEFAIAMSWSGMLIDLVMGPTLLWKRTRPYAAAVLITFHLSNAYLFNIGVFPWLMIAATTLFFEPSWPHRYRRLWTEYEERRFPYLIPDPVIWRQRIITFGVIFYFLLQLLMPLRHHTYLGDVNWNKEGSRFSWRMKLNRRSGRLSVYYSSDQTRGERVRIRLADYLTERQMNKMSLWPDILLDFAHHIKGLRRKEGHRNIKVYAAGLISLNGRPAKHLINYNIDLLDTSRWYIGTPKWICRLDGPYDCANPDRPWPKHRS